MLSGNVLFSQGDRHRVQSHWQSVSGVSWSNWHSVWWTRWRRKVYFAERTLLSLYIYIFFLYAQIRKIWVYLNLQSFSLFICLVYEKKTSKSKSHIDLILAALWITSRTASTFKTTSWKTWPSANQAKCPPLYQDSESFTLIFFLWKRIKL